MNICKNIQWLYEEDKEWKPFPLYLNSKIENAYEEKMPSVIFHLSFLKKRSFS
jgi:hypothetical protein